MPSVPDQPTVCAILLTRDRPEMARRAVACFRAQTYDPIKRLLIILDSGDPAWYDRRCDSENECHMGGSQYAAESIGHLRNIANDIANAEILAHWDSDDISHPNRISEQVALLQASGADVVGYREMLFWRDPRQVVFSGLDEDESGMSSGEAWLYSNPDPRYCIGSSLCYWRAAWERNPFNENLAPTGRGEDHEFWRVLKSVGVRGIGSPIVAEPHPPDEDVPRMICSIHAGNAQHYPSEVMEASPSWKRVPSWDSFCRERMTL